MCVCVWRGVHVAVVGGHCVCVCVEGGYMYVSSNSCRSVHYVCACV